MFERISKLLSTLVPEDESGIRWTIRLKLTAVISALVGLSLVTIIFLASYFFRSDNEVRIEENNRQVAENVRTSVQAELRSRMQTLRLSADNLGAKARTLFESDRSLVLIGVYSSDGKNLEDPQVYTNAESLGGVKPQDLTAKLARYFPAFAHARNGSVVLRNVSADARLPMTAMAFPIKAEGGPRVILAVFRLDDFLSIFQTGGVIKSSLVNEEGTVIAHEDRDVVLSAASYASLPIVQKMRASSINNGLSAYEWEGKSYWGAFRKLDFAGAGVVTYADAEVVFRAVNNIQRWNFLLMAAVISLAVIFVFFFAREFSGHILRLVEASREIENGRFILDLKPETTDEIGLLTRSFVSMGRGLQERANLKESFGRFVNKELAEMAMSGELKLGGVKKDVTVFFSDIRGFTTMSEKLEPEEVVDFLNHYMTDMVKCVQQTHGLVDKFIGDAIMAIWGSLREHGNDAENAVNCALLMRKQLLKFNRGRGSVKKPILRIGCGINSGPVIAGQMGSVDKMDFTVIGDTVNLASRVEHLNKEYGTDIMITEFTYNKLGNNFHIEELEAVTVRGKSKPVMLYAVLGRKDDPDHPRTIKDLRKLMGIEFSGKKGG
jgi:adenylate cyclase